MISIPSGILIVRQILHLEETFVEVNNNLKYITNINKNVSRMTGQPVTMRFPGVTGTRNAKIYLNHQLIFPCLKSASNSASNSM